MIRWLVRKVVKYTMQELLGSEDVKWFLHKHKISEGVNTSGSVSEAKPSVGGVEVDSMKDLAAAMVVKTSEIEIDIKNESEIIPSNKERSADTMRRLSEIGD